MAKSKAPVRAPPPSQNKQLAQDQSQNPSTMDSYDSSPPLDGAAAAAAAAAKKKKKKGKGKRIEDDYDAVLPPSPNTAANQNHMHHQSYQAGNGPVHLSQGAYTATAQAQADLLATASDLYRRIEADPGGIPDDDAYWTSLPAHLRTFIRNALPLGQFPTTGAGGGNNDPNARHASTQAMIAVAQQLAQAAHASQRHLQQYPPGSQPYPSLPFDPAIFADLALHSDGSLPHPHSHPNGLAAGQSPYGHLHYSTGGNMPSTQPPGEPLPAAPVVLVNEYGEEEVVGEYDDEYYSDEDLDGPNGVMHDSIHGDRDGRWLEEQGRGTGGAGQTVQAPGSGKKNKKKKKKKGHAATEQAALPAQMAPLPQVRAAQQQQAQQQQQQQQQPAMNHHAAPPANTTPRGAQPPPSSRAAGKQPMTFASNPAPKTPAAPNGHSHPPSGKRGTAGSATGSHGTAPGANSQPPAQQQRIWSTSTAEERERIKEFWLALGERDRRSLVQVEKDAVLRKMKDQQRHTCSCAVCGRKRSAIESELEVLYNAYYEELQQYANHQQQYVKSGGAIPPPPGPGPFPGSIALDSTGNVIGGNALTRSAPPAQKTRVTAPPKKAPPPPPLEDDDGYDDELDDDDYDDEYDDEDDEEDEDIAPEPPARRKGAAGAIGNANSDVFPLGSSLTVKGMWRHTTVFCGCPQS